MTPDMVEVVATGVVVATDVAGAGAAVAAAAMGGNIRLPESLAWCRSRKKEQQLHLHGMHLLQA